MKLAFATVFTFLNIALAVAVPEPATDNLVKKACHAKDEYCAGHSICCSGTCINPLGPAGGYCK